MLHLKVHLRFSFREHFKIAQKGEEKDAFYVVIDGLLDSAVESVLEVAPKDVINNLYKDAQEATVTCDSKQNFVSISVF